jgi:hypothetical protein
MLPYDRQNIKSSNWQLTNYLDQNYTKVAMGSSTGLVPPPKLVDHESNLLHSEIRGGMFYPETAELRTDCYQYNGNLQTNCNVSMNQFAGVYLPQSQDIGKQCSFKDATFNCQNPFLLSTSVPSQPQKLNHTVEKWTRGGIISQNYNRLPGFMYKEGKGRPVKFSH